MFPSSSHPQNTKMSGRFRQLGSVSSVFSGSHSTVSCHDCNRIMVPRVVNYRGQPLKSICPFCGATFANFSTGFQRFVQRFYTDELSFSGFRQLLMLSLSFVCLWFISDWGNLPDKLSLLAVFGAVFFLTMTVAELVYQVIERLAAKFSHKSSYYWASLVLATMFLASERQDLAGYAILFFVIIFARGLVVGLIQARKKP